MNIGQHSFIHSLILSFIHWFIHSFIVFLKLAFVKKMQLTFFEIQWWTLGKKSFYLSANKLIISILNQ
jgi:hypothetical protein